MASEEEPLTIDGSHSLDIHSLNAPDEQEELEASSMKKWKTEQLSDEVTSEATEEPHTLTQNPPPFTGQPVSSTNELSDEAAYEANEEPDTLMQRPTPCGAQPVSSNVEIYVETVEADEGFSRQRKHSTQHVGQPESADNQEEDHVMPESESDSTKKKEVNNCKKNISPPTEEIINNTGNHPCGVAETNVIEVSQETLKYNQQQTPDASQSATNISKRPDMAPAHNTVDTGSNTTSESDDWRQNSQQPSPLSAICYDRERANNEGSSHSQKTLVDSFQELNHSNECQAARNGPSGFPETKCGARKQPKNRHRGAWSSPQLRNEDGGLHSQADAANPPTADPITGHEPNDEAHPSTNDATDSTDTVAFEEQLGEVDPAEIPEVLAEGFTTLEESVCNEPIEMHIGEPRPQHENPNAHEGNYFAPAGPNGNPRRRPNGNPRKGPRGEPRHNIREPGERAERGGTRRLNEPRVTITPLQVAVSAGLIIISSGVLPIGATLFVGACLWQIVQHGT